MKKTILYRLMMTITVTLFSVSLASCGDDNDEKSGGPLVGVWSCNEHYVDRTTGKVATDTYTFRSDGTYTWNCTSWTAKYGSYNYDPNSGALIIVNQEGTTWAYFVTSLTESSFVLIDEEGYRYRYYKNN
jgi:hypothetical protein